VCDLRSIMIKNDKINHEEYWPFIRLKFTQCVECVQVCVRGVLSAACDRKYGVQKKGTSGEVGVGPSEE
jgi:hypothetical protein